LVDRGWLETGRVTTPGTASVFAGFRFPPEVISVAIRWYLRYGLSYRDVEEWLAERGVTVDHVTIYRWVQRFTPEFIEADHGRLKARLRPMRGLKRHRSARILAAGHAFVQNLRRGHYDIATEVPDRHRLRVAFDDLALTI
jgi:transposase-like protein